MVILVAFADNISTEQDLAHNCCDTKTTVPSALDVSLQSAN